jgi:hypothetical protein
LPSIAAAGRADVRMDANPHSYRSDFAASTESEPVLSPFRSTWHFPHAYFMSLRMIVSDLLAVLVVMSLTSIVLFVGFGAAMGLLTVARAKRQLRRDPGRLDELPGFSGSRDLIEIDASLERIMAEECGALASRLPG